MAISQYGNFMASVNTEEAYTFTKQKKSVLTIQFDSIKRNISKTTNVLTCEGVYYTPHIRRQIS